MPLEIGRSRTNSRLGDAHAQNAVPRLLTFYVPALRIFASFDGKVLPPSLSQNSTMILPTDLQLFGHSVEIASRKLNARITRVEPHYPV